MSAPGGKWRRVALIRFNDPPRPSWLSRVLSAARRILLVGRSPDLKTLPGLRLLTTEEPPVGAPFKHPLLAPEEE